MNLARLLNWNEGEGELVIFNVWSIRSVVWVCQGKIKLGYVIKVNLEDFDRVCRLSANI